MSSRMEILGRLYGRAVGRGALEAWRSRRQFSDLADRFVESLTAAGGEVIRARQWDEALARVLTLLDELGAERVVVTGEEPLVGVDFSALQPHRTWFQLGRDHEGELRDFCAAADVGLTGVAAALAETGTVVVESGATRSRLASLLPPVHVALAPTSALTSDLFTWTAARSGALPAHLTLISGPSKTADIEMTLTVGVHGPRRLIVILYDGGALGDSPAGEPPADSRPGI